jgi:hypothetical protein
VNGKPKYRQHDASVNPDAAPVHAKRALLKAAWLIPVITAISLPRSGYAASISGSAQVPTPLRRANARSPLRAAITVLSAASATVTAKTEFARPH